MGFWFSGWDSWVFRKSEYLGVFGFVKFHRRNLGIQTRSRRSMCAFNCFAFQKQSYGVVATDQRVSTTSWETSNCYVGTSYEAYETSLLTVQLRANSLQQTAIFATRNPDGRWIRGRLLSYGSMDNTRRDWKNSLFHVLSVVYAIKFKTHYSSSIRSLSRKHTNVI